jgi:hypothetical protein
LLHYICTVVVHTVLNVLATVRLFGLAGEGSAHRDSTELLPTLE